MFKTFKKVIDAWRNGLGTVLYILKWLGAIVLGIVLFGLVRKRPQRKNIGSIEEIEQRALHGEKLELQNQLNQKNKEIENEAKERLDAAYNGSYSDYLLSQFGSDPKSRERTTVRDIHPPTFD